MLNIQAFNPHFDDPQYIIPHNLTVKKLGGYGRKWQLEAFEKCRLKPYAFCAAFCGSGKSVVQVALAIDEVIASNYCQKQLIIVPQSHIHQGFLGSESLGYMRIDIAGKEHDWKIADQHNFCDEKSQNVKQKLKKWLLTSGEKLAKPFRDKTITGINAICSHQALGLVWKELSSKQKLKAIKNLTLRVDEAHHVKGVAELADVEEEDYDVDESNTLGEICRFMFANQNKKAHIHLATATPYRGDRARILSDEVSSQFTSYYLNWAEHFKTLGIKHFGVEFVHYGIDPIMDVVEKIKREPNEKHFVVVPRKGEKWRPNHDDYKRLIKELLKFIPKQKILDLVNPKTQAINKQKLLQEPKDGSSEKSQYTVAITCQLGREGTDWCPCSRLHNTACENSITLAIQTLGRPFRRYAGKELVKIYYYTPEFKLPKKGMTERELLSDRINELLICIQLDEMIQPILLTKIVPKNSRGTVASEGADKEEKVTMEELLEGNYQNIKESLFYEVDQLKVKTAKDVEEIINKILDDYKVEEDREIVMEGLKVLVLRCLSPKLQSLGIDVQFMRTEGGFDTIVQKYDLSGKSIFFGQYDESTWDTVKDIFKKYSKKYQDFMFEKIVRESNIISIAHRKALSMARNGHDYQVMVKDIICTEIGEDAFNWIKSQTPQYVPKNRQRKK